MRYGSWATLHIRIRHFHIEERFAETWIETIIYLSVVISSGSSICEGFPLQSLKSELYFDIIADPIEQTY